MWVSIIQSVKSLEEKKGRGRVNLLCLSRDIHFLPPSDIGDPGTQVFELGLEFTPSTPLVLRSLALDWNYTMSFPGGLHLIDDRWLDFSASIIA